MPTYSNGQKLSSSASKARAAAMNQRRIQSKKENNLITGNRAARKKVGSKGSIQTFSPEPIKINNSVVRKNDVGTTANFNTGGHDRVDRRSKKRVIANTDLDKRFNSSGGHDRIDSKRSLMKLGQYKTKYNKGLNSLSKNKNIEKGDRITPLTLLLSAGQGVVNLITGNKGKSQLQKNIQNTYNTHKFGYIKKK